MLRVLRNLIGIQERKELPKRPSTLLHLRLAAASSHPQTNTSIKQEAEKTPALTAPKEPEEMLASSTTKASSNTTKISARIPSDASIQADLNVAAIGSFWEEPRYSKPQHKSNNHPSHTDDDNHFFLTSSYQN